MPSAIGRRIAINGPYRFDNNANLAATLVQAQVNAAVDVDDNGVLTVNGERATEQVWEGFLATVGLTIEDGFDFGDGLAKLVESHSLYVEALLYP